MKKTFKKLTALLLCLVLAIGTIGCGSSGKTTADTTAQETTAEAPAASTAEETSSAADTEADPWASARYTEDQEFGEGALTVQVAVQVSEHTVTFTIHTDEPILGDALLANELVAGEESAYGLYIKEVNGILADYDVDQSYWAFYKDGEYMNTGVDGTEIADGDHYELVYTK